MASATSAWPRTRQSVRFGIAEAAKSRPSRDVANIHVRPSRTALRPIGPCFPYRPGASSLCSQPNALYATIRGRGSCADLRGPRRHLRGCSAAGVAAAIRSAMRAPKHREEDHVQEVFAVDRRRAGALVERRAGHGPEDGRRAQVRNPERQAGPRPGPHVHRRRLHADRLDLQQPDPRQPRAEGRAATRPHLGGQRGQLGVDVPPGQERQVHQRPPGDRPRRQVLVRAHPRSGDRLQGPQGHGPIETITAADDHTLVIKLKGPYADLPLQLGNTFARVIARRTWRRSATTRSAPVRSSSRSTSPATRRSWRGTPTTSRKGSPTSTRFTRSTSRSTRPRSRP